MVTSIACLTEPSIITHAGPMIWPCRCNSPLSEIKCTPFPISSCCVHIQDTVHCYGKTLLPANEGCVCGEPFAIDQRHALFTVYFCLTFNLLIFPFPSVSAI